MSTKERGTLEFVSEDISVMTPEGVISKVPSKYLKGSYEHFADSKPPWSPMGSCSHLRIRCDGGGQGAYVRSSGFVDWPLRALTGFGAGHPRDLVGQLSEPDGFNGRATNAMMDLLKQNFIDVAVQLAELTELGTTIAPIGSGLKGVFSQVRNAKERGIGRTARALWQDVNTWYHSPRSVEKYRDTAKVGASAHLWYAFGVAPLVEVMRDGNQALRKALKLADKVLKNSGSDKVQRRHYKETLDFDDVTVVNYGPDSLGLTIGHVVKAHVAEFNATMHYTYTVPKVEMFGQDLTALAMVAETLGFGNPRNVIWNMIPLSFVVDWFSNLGKILTYQNKSDRLTDIVFDVSGFCISSKRNATVEYFASGDGPGNTVGQVALVERYTRNVVPPNLESHPPALQMKSGLTWGQIAISASLLTNFS